MRNQETSGVVDEVVVEKLVKRASVSLTAGGSKLTILALRKKDGSAVTTVTTTDAKKKSTRGMTKRFETFDAACEALKTLAQEAAKKVWKKSERSGGFATCTTPRRAALRYPLSPLSYPRCEAHHACDSLTRFSCEALRAEGY